MSDVEDTVEHLLHSIVNHLPVHVEIKDKLLSRVTALFGEKEETDAEE